MVKSLIGLIIGVAMFSSNSLTVLADENEIERKLDKGELIFNSESEEGTKIKKGKVTGIVDAPPNIVWQIIGDNNHFKDFMPRTLESKVVDKDKIPMIRKKSPKDVHEILKIIGKEVNPKIYHVTGGKYSIYFFSLLNLPWPVENRWYVIKLDCDETDAAQGIYRSSWDLVIGNLRDNYGSWHLEPYDGKERTKVTYILLSDPGGIIPTSLINWLAPGIFKDILRAVRKKSKELMIKNRVNL